MACCSLEFYGCLFVYITSRWKDKRYFLIVIQCIWRFAEEYFLNLSRWMVRLSSAVRKQSNVKICLPYALSRHVETTFHCQLIGSLLTQLLQVKGLVVVPAPPLCIYWVFQITWIEFTWRNLARSHAKTSAGIFQDRLGSLDSFLSRCNSLTIRMALSNILQWKGSKFTFRCFRYAVENFLKFRIDLVFLEWEDFGCS